MQKNSELVMMLEIDSSTIPQTNSFDDFAGVDYNP